MSDELDRSRPDSPRPVPDPADRPVRQPGEDAGQPHSGDVGADPNYILSQREFHETLAGVRVGISGEVRRQVEGLRKTGGWLAISFACWLLFIGWTMLQGDERGRPR